MIKGRVVGPVAPCTIIVKPQKTASKLFTASESVIRERTRERVANYISFGTRALPLSICFTVYTSRSQLLSAPRTN